MKLAGREQVAGGFMVTIEIENAYTDGRSRFDTIFVADASVRGKTLEQVQQAVIDAINGDPFTPLTGQVVTTPTQTKAILWERAKAAYADWQMAKNTRIEAQARSMAAAVITALTNAENATWTDYTTTLNQWRLAPA